MRFNEFSYFPIIKSDFLPHYNVIKYETSRKAEWNAFVDYPLDHRGGAKNATFLFNRDFMEYHADRFEDYSLMVFEGEKLVALLAANKVDETLFSHQGLTYGGLVLSAKAKMKEILPIFKKIMAFLAENKVKNLIIKPIPSSLQRICLLKNWNIYFFSLPRKRSAWKLHR